MVVLVDDEEALWRGEGLTFSALGGAVGVPDLAAVGPDGVITSPSPDRARLRATAATALTSRLGVVAAVVLLALPRCEDCDLNNGDLEGGGSGVRGCWGRSAPRGALGRFDGGSRAVSSSLCRGRLAPAKATGGGALVTGRFGWGFVCRSLATVFCNRLGILSFTTFIFREGCEAKDPRSFASSSSMLVGRVGERSGGSL